MLCTEVSRNLKCVLSAGVGGESVSFLRKKGWDMLLFLLVGRLRIVERGCRLHQKWKVERWKRIFPGYSGDNCILSFLLSKCHFVWSDLFRFPIRGLSRFSCPNASQPSSLPSATKNKRRKGRQKKQINAKQNKPRTNVQRTNIFKLQEGIRFFLACEHTHKSKTHFYYPNIEQI